MSINGKIYSICVCFIFATPLYAEQSVEIKIGSFLPDFSQTHSIVFAELAKKIESESDGTITTSLHAETPFSIQPILDGELDITFIPPNLVTQYFPDSGILQVPGLFPLDVAKSSEIHQKLYDSGKMKRHGKLKPLAAASGGYLTLHLGYTFDGLASLNGKIGGVSPNTQEGSFLDSLGVSLVDVPVGQHLHHMESGEIDLAVQNWAGASYLWNLLPAVAEHVHVNLGHIPAMLVINTEKYNSLSDKQRAAIDSSTGAWLTPLFQNAMVSGHRRALEIVKNNGAPITEISNEDQAIVDGLYDEALNRWILENSNAEEILEIVRNYINEK